MPQFLARTPRPAWWRSIQPLQPRPRLIFPHPEQPCRPYPPYPRCMPALICRWLLVPCAALQSSRCFIHRMYTLKRCVSVSDQLIHFPPKQHCTTHPARLKDSITHVSGFVNMPFTCTTLYIIFILFSQYAYHKKFWSEKLDLIMFPFALFFSVQRRERILNITKLHVNIERLFTVLF